MLQNVFLLTNSSYIHSPYIVLAILANPEFIKVPAAVLNYTANVYPIVEVTATGIPKPPVKWLFFNGGNSLDDGVETGNIMEYVYKYELPLLTNDHCGRMLSWTLSRGDISITNSSKVMVLCK